MHLDRFKPRVLWRILPPVCASTVLQFAIIDKDPPPLRLLKLAAAKKELLALVPLNADDKAERILQTHAVQGGLMRFTCLFWACKAYLGSGRLVAFGRGSDVCTSRNSQSRDQEDKDVHQRDTKPTHNGCETEQGCPSESKHSGHVNSVNK